MTMKEIRELTPEEHQQKLFELRQEYFNLRCQHKTGQLEDPTRLKFIRRDIARMLTAGHARQAVVGQ